MKVTIRQDSPRRADWIHVFGASPVEVEPDGKKRLRVRLDTLTMLRKQRLARHISQAAKLPADMAAKLSAYVDADDVVVVEELFP